MNHTLKNLLLPVLFSMMLLVLGDRALSASTPAPTCDPALPQHGCLYFPSAQYGVNPVITATVIYTDSAGLPRSVRFALRVPISAPVPMPVVIWARGDLVTWRRDGARRSNNEHGRVERDDCPSRLPDYQHCPCVAYLYTYRYAHTLVCGDRRPGADHTDVGSQ